MIRLTRRQVREIDRLAVERYHIPDIVLMENAARAVSDVAIEMLNNDATSQKVLILCGGGNNGGDGLAVARHLHNRGADISILLTSDPDRYVNEAKTNWEIIRAMGLPAAAADASAIELSRPQLVIDAIFGTGLSQPPRDPFADIARAVETIRVPILAVDLPSGLDCDSGRPLGRCISATRTVTFVAEKIGFAQAAALEYLGQITVADIGCPRELIEQVRASKS